MEGRRRTGFVGAIVATFTENVGLKLTSLVIALALFGVVRGAGTVQRSIEVNLLARLPPPTANRVLLTDLPDKVRVTVSGSPSLVGSLHPDELGPVQIDLSDGQRSTVSLDPALFQLPGGVQITAVQPAALQLSWDALEERVVTVRAAMTGNPAVGMHFVGDPEVTPPTIHVSGPAIYVEGLTSLRTEAIDVGALGPGHYERRVTLEPPRHHARYDFNESVRVGFTIEREIVERTFDHVLLAPVSDGRVEVRPPFVTVTVRGPPQLVRGLDAAQLVPTVEIGEPLPLNRGGTRFPVTAPQVPDGVTLVAIEPTDVIVLAHP